MLEAARAQLPACKVYQNTSFVQTYRNGLPEWFEIPHHNALRFIWGHHVHEQMLGYLKRPPVLFTCLREPKDRLESAARYTRRLMASQGRVFDLAEWSREQRNPVCRFITERFPSVAVGGSDFDKARSVLEHFSYVFFTEDFNSGVLPIAELLGVSVPEARSNVSTSKDELDLDYDIVSEDVALYAWAKAYFRGRSIEPVEYLYDLVSHYSDLESLERFLFRAQARELKGWGLLDQLRGDCRTVQRRAEIQQSCIEEFRG